MNTPTENVAKLAKRIKDVRVAMLTTIEADGSLRSRPMATQQTEFDGTLWFFTWIDSAKVHEIERDHHVNITYANQSDEVYVSVSGMARLVRDPAKAKELWNPLHKAWFPQGLDDPNLGLLRVDVEKAEYWDSPSSKAVQLVGFAKSIATGKSYANDAGELEKITR
jgi:general stress protein 26